MLQSKYLGLFFVKECLAVGTLGKKLGSVLLCSSMAVTLVGSSGTHATDEVSEGLKDGQRVEESASNEETDASDGQDVEGAAEEADASDDQDAEGADNAAVPERDESDAVSNNKSGVSKTSAVVKGLGTAVLGVGLGVSADQIFQRVVKKGSNGPAGSAAGKIDEERIVVNSPKFKELQDKLAKAEEELSKFGPNATVDGNWGEVYSMSGAAALLSKFVPEIRNKLKEKGINVGSNSSLVIMIFFQALGAAFAAWNILKLVKGRNTMSKGGKFLGSLHVIFDFLIPPVGLVWEAVEKIVTDIKQSGSAGPVLNIDNRNQQPPAQPQDQNNNPNI